MIGFFEVVIDSIISVNPYSFVNRAEDFSKLDFSMISRIFWEFLTISWYFLESRAVQLGSVSSSELSLGIRQKFSGLKAEVLEIMREPGEDSEVLTERVSWVFSCLKMSFRNSRWIKVLGSVMTISCLEVSNQKSWTFVICLDNVFLPTLDKKLPVLSEENPYCTASLHFWMISSFLDFSL